MHSNLSWRMSGCLLVLFLACQAHGQTNVVRTFTSQQLTDVYYSEGVGVGDINGDNHIDIVYGPYWFAGPGFSAKYEIYKPVPQPTERYADHFFAWVHDFDSNGANDILVVGFPGTPAYVYENPGRGEGAWRKHEILDWVSNESPQFVDIVGDDRPELVCTRDGFFGFATVNWEKPFSTWEFHPISEQVTAAKFGHGLGIGDVNGDGRMDVIHAGGWYQQPNTDPTSGRWLEHKVKFTSAYGGAEMFAYDVDGDGDNDIVTSEAAHDFGISWYEQTGLDQFTRHVIVGNDRADSKYGVLFTEPHSVQLVDMDGDGLKDIVSGKTYWSHHKQSPMWDAGAVVYWFKLVRSAEGVDWLPYLADGGAGIGRQIALADINQDGLMDIATGGMLGAHVLLQKAKEVDAAEFKAAQPKVYEGPRVAPITDAAALRGPRSPIRADGTVLRAIEGESVRADVTAGTAEPQAMGNFSADHWSGKSQLWWKGAKPGDKLTLPLDAMQDIERLEIVLTCARDYAIVELQLDDKPLGEAFDLFNPEVITTGVLSFSTPQLKKGKHTLTIEIKGANRAALKSFMVGIDYLRFRVAGDQEEDEDDGIRPRSADGAVVNLDFETGTLDDWVATGQAFADQPIKGDTVAARRSDMRSAHQGEFWIGGFERHKDAPKGTLTSKPFRATARYATFYVAGGSSDKTRVELFKVGDDKPFYTISGQDSEVLSRVVVDLRRAENSDMVIRLVDDSSTGWGHISFDHFRLHAERPGPLTPPAITLVADEYPHAGLDAESAARAMVLPKGFSVIPCAAEPDVKQPIAMALDDRGRTWIAEAYEYPQRAEGDKGRDRILVFEDTNGDGKFDSRKVFAEGFNLISGLEVGFGGVWVGAAPYLMFIPDRNHDDVPDGEPEILLDGWAWQDTHETLNAFTWGPDGWLYGCHGVFTHSNVGKPGASDEQRQRINAGVWRYHPLRHEFEVFAHGSSNPWGVDFDQYGEAFITACVIPHLYHVIPGARYQRQAGQHFNPYTYDDIKTIADHLHYLGATPHSGNGKSDEAGGGHAHAGAMIYQGGAWPKEYAGALFMNNIHGQRLNVDILEPRGSGYVGRHGPDFLLTGDQASQILNMRYGPDGQVTFIDWYDMQACHRKEVEVHDRSNGRIYKVVYGKPAPIRIDLRTKSDMQLAEYCLHENDWYVRHARRLLQERAAERKIAADAIAFLENVMAVNERADRQLRALWARFAIGSLGERQLLSLMNAASPHVRAWAVRLAMQQNLAKPSASMVAQMLKMSVGDPSQVVRLALATALGKLPVESRWELTASLVAHAEDRDDHNLPLMYWYGMEPLADLDPDRALALGISAGQNIPMLRDFMLRKVAGSGGAEAVNRLVGGLNSANSPELQLTFLTAIRTALAGQRSAPKPKLWDQVADRLLSSPSAEVGQLATALGVAFGDAKARAAMRKTVSDSSADEGQRLLAIETLLAVKDADLLSELLEIASQSVAGALREAAIRGLAQYDSDGIGTALVADYQGYNASERRAAIATLTSRATNAKKLLNAIANKQIASSELTADFARQLEYLKDEEVNALLESAWGKVRASSADKAALVEKYKSLVANPETTSDLELGRAIFNKTCQRCHMLYGIGEKLGPDLTGSNRANLDYLLENIVDPSAVMANEYRQSVFLTVDGQVVTGIVRSETENAVTVQTADAVIVLPKNEIEQRQASEKSMMPDDQLSQFSPHEIVSLIGYLRGRSQTAMLATADNATLLFNTKDLSLWNGNSELWTVEGGEIVGKSSGLAKNEFLVSDLSAENFVLSMEVRLVDNAGNSGVQFRSVAREDGVVEGYQADVGAGWWGKLYEEHGRALLWETSGEQHVKHGEWNKYRIEADGSQIRTWINDQPCVNLNDPEGRKRGIFALQLHSGGPTEVRFRNLQLEINP
ncbi:MAG: DUF1080 domain-containing protein [Planctomycetales bacterium]|nr:DUF1080 domain-containing protein [Planctomycetales bacterium]